MCRRPAVWQIGRRKKGQVLITTEIGAKTYIIAGNEGAGFQRQKKRSWKMPITKGKLDK